MNLVNKRVTLRDVAIHCKVSASTVSSVVRQVNNVKESTRKRVQAAIAELGYASDPAMRALAAYRTRTGHHSTNTYKETLAFLDSEPSDFSRSMFEACRREGKCLGYELQYFPWDVTLREQATYSQRLWSLGIRGVILGPSRQKYDLRGLDHERFAMVAIGALQHTPAIDSVTPDYFQGLYLAAEHCHEMGRQRIALLVADHLQQRSGHRWLGAYLSFCYNYQHEPLVWLYQTKQHPPAKKIASWAKDNRIDAILTLADILPSNISGVLEIDLNDWQINPSIGYISTPQELIARESLHVLDDHLIHRRFGIQQWPRQITIKPFLRGKENDPES